MNIFQGFGDLEPGSSIFKVLNSLKMNVIHDFKYVNRMTILSKLLDNKLVCGTIAGHF